VSLFHFQAWLSPGYHQRENSLKSQVKKSAIAASKGLPVNPTVLRPAVRPVRCH
jgi:hypothetical protein